MTTEFNRRTFLALIGASTATVAIARPSWCPPSFQAVPTGTPRHFMDELKTQLPARPKTMAITYLSE